MIMKKTIIRKEKMKTLVSEFTQPINPKCLPKYLMFRKSFLETLIALDLLIRKINGEKIGKKWHQKKKDSKRIKIKTEMRRKKLGGD